MQQLFEGRIFPVILLALVLGLSILVGAYWFFVDSFTHHPIYTDQRFELNQNTKEIEVFVESRLNYSEYPSGWPLSENTSARSGLKGLCEGYTSNKKLYQSRKLTDFSPEIWRNKANPSNMNEEQLEGWKVTAVNINLNTSDNTRYGYCKTQGGNITEKTYDKSWEKGFERFS